MNRYRVKVTEKHSDYVWIDALNADLAMAKAPLFAHCEYECLYDCEVVSEESIDSPEK